MAKSRGVFSKVSTVFVFTPYDNKVFTACSLFKATAVCNNVVLDLMVSSGLFKFSRVHFPT